MRFQARVKTCGGNRLLNPPLDYESTTRAQISTPPPSTNPAEPAYSLDFFAGFESLLGFELEPGSDFELEPEPDFEPESDLESESDFEPESPFDSEPLLLSDPFFA